MVCEICRQRVKKSFKTTIHFTDAVSKDVHLCYAHDLELFKMGQVRFIKKYESIVCFKQVSTLGSFDSDLMEFVS